MEDLFSFSHEDMASAPQQPNMNYYRTIHSSPVTFFVVVISTAVVLLFPFLSVIKGNLSQK